MSDCASSGPRTLRGLTESLGGYGEEPAILKVQREGIEHWSFAKLGDHVNRLAAGLAAKRIGRGNQVALLSQNRPEWIVAALSIIHAGAAAVPVDVQLND